MGHAHTLELQPKQSVSNLIFQDRFDGTLSGWTTTGTASIVTVDLSTKMRLDNSVAQASATRTFAQQSRPFIIEADVLFSAANAVSVQLLNTASVVVAMIDCGTTANTLSFNTDTVGATTKTFGENTYNQLVFCVNPTTSIIKAYWIDKSYGAINFNPLQLIASKSYSGAGIAAIKFITQSGKFGTVNIDEVRCYTPDFAIIGDSISEGKRPSSGLSWGSDPSSTFRLTGTPDQTSSPGYFLSALLGSNVWVGTRGFGGSKVSELVTLISSLISTQGFSRVFINSGFNDLNASVTAATLISNMTTVINTLLSAGLRPRDLFIANIFGSAALSGAKATERISYNTSLTALCASTGTNLIDANAILSTTPVTNSLLAIYDSGDGVHPNKTGSLALAQAVFNKLYGDYMGSL